MKINLLSTQFLKLSQELSGKDKLKILSSLNSFSKRIKYCQENFQQLSSGSSRIVYVYDDKYVLKLAKNPKGLAQNLQEADGFIQQNYQDIVSNVIDSDPNDYWILVERGQKISKQAFKNIAGFSLDQLQLYLSEILLPPPQYGRKYKDRQGYLNLDNNEFAQRILGLTGNIDLLIDDLTRPSAWGLFNGKLKLIDYGLTKSEYQNLYG